MVGFDFKSVLEKYLTPENLAQVEAFIGLAQTLVVQRIDLTAGKYMLSIYKVPRKEKPPMIRIDIAETTSL